MLRYSRYSPSCRQRRWAVPTWLEVCPSESQVLDNEHLEARFEDVEYEEAALLAQFVDRDDALEGVLVADKGEVLDWGLVSDNVEATVGGFDLPRWGTWGRW